MMAGNSEYKGVEGREGPGGPSGLLHRGSHRPVRGNSGTDHEIHCIRPLIVLYSWDEQSSAHRCARVSPPHHTTGK